MPESLPGTDADTRKQLWNRGVLSSALSIWWAWSGWKKPPFHEGRFLYEKPHVFPTDSLNHNSMLIGRKPVHHIVSTITHLPHYTFTLDNPHR